MASSHQAEVTVPRLEAGFLWLSPQQSQPLKTPPVSAMTKQPFDLPAEHVDKSSRASSSSNSSSSESVPAPGYLKLGHSQPGDDTDTGDFAVA